MVHPRLIERLLGGDRGQALRRLGLQGGQILLERRLLGVAALLGVHQREQLGLAVRRPLLGAGDLVQEGGVLLVLLDQRELALVLALLGHQRLDVLLQLATLRQEVRQVLLERLDPGPSGEPLLLEALAQRREALEGRLERHQPLVQPVQGPQRAQLVVHRGLQTNGGDVVRTSPPVRVAVGRRSSRIRDARRRLASDRAWAR